MEYEPVYSERFSDSWIRDLFFGAKYSEKRCDFCDSSNVYFVDDEKKRLRCRNCWKRSSLTHGTYLENTKLGLRFWYEVIWSFVLDHTTAKTRKLLRTNNHQKILRIYRTIRKALTDNSENNLNNITRNADFRNNSPEEKNEALRKKITEFLDLDGDRNHPIYFVYDANDYLYLKLIKKPKRVFEAEGFSPGGAPELDGVEPVGFGCLFHGKGEYLKNPAPTQLEGLWNFTKSHMGIYQGVRKENWRYYLKEIEFKYNHRKRNFRDQTSELVNILMGEKPS